MDTDLIAKPLAARQIEQAFALIRTLVPDLDINRWRAYAATVLAADAVNAAEPPAEDARPARQTAGILTAQTPDGYIHGLFCYRVDTHLQYGRVLSADNFIVLDLIDPSAATAVLLRALEQLARTQGCQAICTTLPEAQDRASPYGRSMLRSFQQQGHTVQTVRLSKPLDGANDDRTPHDQSPERTPGPAVACGGA